MPYNGCQSDRIPCYPPGNARYEHLRRQPLASQVRARKVSRGKCHRERVANMCMASCNSVQWCAAAKPGAAMPSE